MFNRRKWWGKLVALCLMFAFLFGTSGLMMPGVASGADMAVTITGDGVAEPTTFTQADLESFEQVQANYSSINTWPTKKWYVAEGVRLADLLEAAGITDDAKLITVKSTDGYKMTFTKKELLDDSRYYFPGLKENHEYFGEIPGSPDGAEPVDVLLALKSVDSDNPEYMNAQNSPLLIFGQRYVTEQTNHAFAKYVSTIEVSTATPDKWADPTATPADGTVEAGTGVVLESENNDADKVYYTTDNSDPSYESPMYNWIAMRWWGSRGDDVARINHPVEISQNTTIKAITIGIGKEDSDIVTFEYQVPVLDPAPVLTADSTDNEVRKAIDITFPTDAAWETAITEITVNGSALTSDQYTVTAGNLNIAASVFTAAGDYVIVVKATGYADATVTQTIVAAPPVFTIEGNAVAATSYTMAELQAMPATTKTFGTYVCKGVDFKYLLESLGVINDPSWTAKIKTADFPNGFSLNLSYALDPVNNCLLTYEMDGAPINELSPLRLYHGDGTSSKSVYKYVTGIMITKPADPPALVADTTDNEVGQAVDINFPTDAAWEAAITEITVNGSALTGDQYTVTAGNLNIAASVFTAAGDYEIVVKATGYSDATVTQTINESPIAGAEILLSSISGIPGVTIFVTGSGFDADTAGTIWFDTNDNGVLDNGEPSVAVNTDEDGAIPQLTSLTVSSESTGSYTVRADISGIEATASFTITNSGIIVNPTNGNCRVSSGITVTGSGFTPSTSFRLFVDRNGNGVFDDGMYRDGTTTASGTVSVTGMSWPSSPTGIYSVLLDLGKDGTIDASASIVITPIIYISSSIGNPGTNIGMNIDGFQANATGYVWFDTNGNGVWDEGENQAPVTTSNAGTATSPGLYVPSVTPGPYQVCAEIPACGLKASTTYTVRGVALNPSSGTAGTSIAITGYGYAPNKTSGYYIWFDTNGNGTWDADEAKVEVTTDASGNLHPVSLIAPAVPAGTYNVCASFVSPVNFAVFTVNDTTPEPANYTVTFTVTPEGATVVLKDSENAVVIAEADGTYKLEAGTYSYTVSAEGYVEQTGTFTVAEADQTITVVLEEIEQAVFTIEGNAVAATSYTMAELQAMPATTKTFGTFVCKGVDFKYLLESLGVINDPSWTMKIKTVDVPNGFNFNLSYALDPVNNCLLTYERDGAPINESSPLRLYHGDGTSSKSVYKYVTGIMITKPTDPPALVADTTDNEVGQAVDINFPTDAAWETAITEITVNGSALTGDQYTVTAGNLNIAASVFTAAGDYAIVVKATGYVDATVTQTMVAVPINPNPVYTVAPVDDPIYTPGIQNGITTMTVNAGIIGFKYFAVHVAPVTPHEGTEAVVFTHTRNNAQMTINVTKADFDIVSIAQAGFNVLAGDVVRVYVVDDLTNSRTINPIILQ